MRQIVGRADARDFFRRVEEGGGELARHHIGFVALRHREQQIRVAQARLFQYRGVRGIAANRAHIELVLQRREAFRVGIDDGDVVGLRREIFRDGGTDLPRAQYDNFQITFSRRMRDSSLCASAALRATDRARAERALPYGIMIRTHER